jgi:hypothetical protein
MFPVGTARTGGTVEAELVVVRSFGDRIEAEMARSALEAAGIRSMVRGDDCAGLRPHMSLGSGIELIVRAMDRAKALEVLGIRARDVS